MSKKKLIKNGEKGITLIALIVTIIVLLILAMVVIRITRDSGLVEYARKAVKVTKDSIKSEQNIMDIMVGGERVEVEQLEIGDYVNYPVKYTNVATVYEGNTGSHYPKDEFTGWRVLSKETDEQGNILYIKLISAGVPLNYYNYWYNPEDLVDEYGNPIPYPNTGVENLTTNFLKTKIKSKDNSYSKNFRFLDCGFENVTGATLEATFSNKFTDKVQALTLGEVYKAITDLGGSPMYGGYSDVTGSQYKNLFAIPCKGSDSSEYAHTFVAEFHDYGSLWHIDAGLHNHYFGSDTAGVRVVVSLKPSVKFKTAFKKINQTATWDISL